MHIESIRLQNFKSFKDTRIDDLPNLCALVGANGTGKTTLLGVFEFLKDCVTFNVRDALQNLGGFKEVVSRGTETGACIEIEIQFRINIEQRQAHLNYLVSIGEENKTPVVFREVLRDSQNQALIYLDYALGQGRNTATNQQSVPHGVVGIQKISMQGTGQIERDTLALSLFGRFPNYEEVFAIHKAVRGWKLADIDTHAARGSKDASGMADHLLGTGGNLQLVARTLFENHPAIFQTILHKMRARIPGISNITPKLTEDGRLLLQFSDGAFTDPFIDRHVSDGTIKMFAYMVLLHDPQPHSLLCIEEPENQLYPSLLAELAEEFRAWAERGGQVMVSTHSPDFLNAMALDEVIWLQKVHGYSQFFRARDNQQIAAYMNDGDKMGYLWNEGFFTGAHPQ